MKNIKTKMTKLNTKASKTKKSKVKTLKVEKSKTKTSKLETSKTKIPKTKILKNKMTKSESIANRKKASYNELTKKLSKATMLDDVAFSLLAQNKDFCEEFLRVLLQEKDLKVISNQPQKFLSGFIMKSTRLDLLCKVNKKRLINVEVQIHKEKKDSKRVFTYGAKIRTATFKRGKKYVDAEEIIIIYLTKKDIFKKGSTVYEVKMNVVSDQNEIVSDWKCGFSVYYINTEGLTNKNIYEYLKLFTDRTTFNEKYKITNEMKKNLSLKGENKMSKELKELIDISREEGRVEGRVEGRKEGKIANMISLVKKKLIGIDVAIKELGISETKFKKLMKTV